MARFVVLVAFSLLLLTHTQCEEQTRQCIADMRFDTNESYMHGEQSLAIVTDSPPPSPLTYGDDTTEEEMEEVVVEEEYDNTYPDEGFAGADYYNEEEEAEFESDHIGAEEEEDVDENQGTRETEFPGDEIYDNGYGIEYEANHEYNVDDFGDGGYEEEEHIDDDGDDFDFDGVDEGEEDDEDDTPVSMRMAAGKRRLADMAAYSPPNMTEFDDDY